MDKLNIQDCKSNFETLNTGVFSAIKTHNNFLSNMAYQMRTALNAITGFSDILSCDLTDEEHKGYAREIHTASKGLVELVNDVIQFTKLDTENVSIEKKQLSVRDIFEEIQSMAIHKASQKNIGLELSVCDTVPQEVYCSQRYFRDCISRLTELTIKFSSKGSVLINADYTADELLRVEFKGCGITLDGQKRKDLFEPFSENCDDIYKEIGDTGLGFAIVAKIADAIGAALTVSQDAKNQSLFTFSIPCPQQLNTEKNQNRSRLVDEFIRQRQDGIVERTKINKDKPRILVAEDSSSVQTIIRIMLKRRGFDVCIVPDGLEAVAKVISDDFDLVLMDMRMPKLNGIDAIKQIRKEGITLPIIALTALDQNDLVDAEGEDLIDGYIPKPFDEDKLMAVLGNFMVIPEKVKN